MPNKGDLSFELDWLDTDKAIRAAKRRGWTESESLWDYTDEMECRHTRRFPSLAMAKGWAQRRPEIDLFSNPRVYTYEWTGFDWSDNGEKYELNCGEWDAL